MTASLREADGLIVVHRPRISKDGTHDEHPPARLMTEDRDVVRGSLDTVSDWRLTRPADVPGQAIGQAD